MVILSKGALEKDLGIFLRNHISSSLIEKRLFKIITHNLVFTRNQLPPVPLISFQIAKHLGLSEKISRGLAIACALFYSAADYADDLADGDLDSPTGVAVNDVCFLLFLTQKAILQIPGVSEGNTLKILSLFSNAGLTMAKGQDADLSAKNLTHQQLIRLAQKKAGAEMALFFTAPPLLAGTDHALWSNVGCRMGTLIQILSDYTDLFLNPEMEDWVDGKQTLPLVMGLKDPRYGKILRDLWGKNRVTFSSRKKALQTLLQCHLQIPLYQLAKKEFAFIRHDLCRLNQPVFLFRLLNSLEEMIESVCQALEETPIY